MDELDMICNELLENPSNEVEVNKAVIQEPNIDVDKLILRLDGIESENKELSNKLEKLIEYMKIMGNRIKNNNNGGFLDEYKMVKYNKKIRNVEGLKHVYVYIYNYQTSYKFAIYNVSNVYKELKLLDMIKYESEYFSNIDKDILKDFVETLSVLKEIIDIFEKYEEFIMNKSGTIPGHFRFVLDHCGISRSNGQPWSDYGVYVPVISDVIRLSSDNKYLPLLDIEMVWSNLQKCIEKLIDLKKII